MNDLTPIRRRLLAASDAIAGDQPDDPLFLHSCLCQTYLPTKKQPDEVRRWERQQGQAHLRVEAGHAWHPGKGEFIDLPLPYGAKARIILMHLNSEAVRQRSHVIEVETSLTAFATKVQGREATGRDIRAFKDQLSALAAASITMALDRPDRAVPPAYVPLRHRFAGKRLQGGGGWRRAWGWAGPGRGAPATLAETGPRPSRGGGCRPGASGRRCSACCGARTWSWSRASSASPPPS